MPARRTSRPRGFRPQTEWAAQVALFSLNIGFQTKTLLGSFTTGAPTTIRRTFGLVNWRSDQQAASEEPVGAFGMCIVSEDAFAAGAAAIPGPFTDASSDLWFVHQFLYSAFQFLDATGVTNPTGSQYKIDSKAMRKLTEEERLVVMVENGHGTQGALFWHAIRVLSSAASR